MNLYAILRRDGFTDGPTLEAAAARSTKVGDDMQDDIRWIRSYVLDQSRIKDLRTNVETGNTQAVLDGDLDQFVEASLKQGLSD